MQINILKTHLLTAKRLMFRLALLISRLDFTTAFQEEFAYR
jgi:hypothetical protein